MSLVSSASVTNLYIESIVVGGSSVVPLVMLESDVEYTAGFSGGGQGGMLTARLTVGVWSVWGWVLESLTNYVSQLSC